MNIVLNLMCWNVFKGIGKAYWKAFDPYLIEYNAMHSIARLHFRQSARNRYHREAAHHMMTSSNGSISPLTICAGNPPVPGEFPTQMPVTRGFGVFFDLHPNKRLSKHWWSWWFETPSCPLWRHCNDYQYAHKMNFCDLVNSRIECP